MQKLHQDVCRIHSKRSDTDILRISPSKLTKRELEELYFNVLENNEELKKTVNAQTEKLRVQSTKLLRVNSAQKRHLCKTPTKCCINAHDVIEGLNSTIEDLQNTNIRLASKIRLLDMRLCTKKQLTKYNPSRASSKYRIMSAATSRKTVDGTESDAGSNIAGTVDTPRSLKDCESNESDVRTVITNDAEPAVKDYDHTNCEAKINELKHTIDNLQEELKVARSTANTLEEKTQSLKEEMTKGREDVRGAARRVTEQHVQQLHQLTVQLRESQAAASSISAELAIEKKKVNELNTQLKAALTSKDVVNMLEEHLMQIAKNGSNPVGSAFELELSSAQPIKEQIEDIQKQDTNPGMLKEWAVTVPGLTDILTIKQTENLQSVEIIKLLMGRIHTLQIELDALKVSQVLIGVSHSRNNEEGIKLLTPSVNEIVKQDECLPESDNIASSEDVSNSSKNLMPFKHRKPSVRDSEVQTTKLRVIDINTQTSSPSKSISACLENAESSSGKTYVVKALEKDKQSESIPSNNTEQDVASITDASTRDRESISGNLAEMSKTEDTSTEYSSYSESFDNTLNMLSDGEIPTYLFSGVRRRSSSDIRSSRFRLSEAKKIPAKSGSTSVKLEEALRAVSAELNRCKTLLQPRSNRGGEV